MRPATSRPAPSVTPQFITVAERSDAALKVLLGQLLAVMQQNSAAIISAHDNERLHDYRVAVRRSRSLLDQLPQLLPKRIEQRYSNHFAQLGTLTTPLRDLDVVLLKFESYRALLPKRLQNSLDPLRQLIETKRQQQRQLLIKHLQSAGYRRFIKSWQAYLESPTPANTTLGNAKRPVKELADSRIWRLYQQVLQQGAAITKLSPANDLHALRKRCKKLRYLIDSFQPLYPEKKIQRLIATLKTLQDHLGEFQDLCVHHDLFQTLAAELPDALEEKALQRLIHALEKQQRQQRKHFHTYFKNFAGKKNQQRFKELFKA